MVMRLNTPNFTILLWNRWIPLFLEIADKFVLFLPAEVLEYLIRGLIAPSLNSKKHI